MPLAPRPIPVAWLMSLVGIALLASVVGGLMRAGVVAPALSDNALAGRALTAHAALMLSCFLGTVIAIERAVALKSGWSFAAPLASGLAGGLLLAGQTTAAAWLGVGAAGVFVAVNALVVARQRAAHTMLLLLGALAWLAGNLAFALRPDAAAALPWWFAFVVLTIAAERLEMARLMRHPRAARPLLQAILAALLAGAAITPSAPVAGGVLFGAALSALALWLGVFDIARRTVFAHGLSRYMALCLLAGYAWLASAGVAWLGMALGWPTRDWALHALGLGFIVSMVMGHAPVILPAVARIKLRFGPWFYAPLALLHASLLLRLIGGLADPALRRSGAALNAAALVLFIVTVAGSALVWRARRGAPHPHRTLR